MVLQWYSETQKKILQYNYTTSILLTLNQDYIYCMLEDGFIAR